MLRAFDGPGAEIAVACGRREKDQDANLGAVIDERGELGASIFEGEWLSLENLELPGVPETLQPNLDIARVVGAGI